MGNFQKGWTLVEIVVVTLLSGLLMGTAFQIYSYFHGRFQTDVTERLVLQMMARQASDQLLLEIKKATDLVRPWRGETLPFMVFKDMKKRMCFLYLDQDPLHSERFKKDLYKLKMYVTDYSGTFNPSSEKMLVDSVERLTFTSITPSAVQVDMTLGNNRQRFQYVTHIGFMNVGDLE